MTPTTSSARVLLDVALPRTLDQWIGTLTARPMKPGTTVEGWLYEGVETRRAAEQRLASTGIEAHLHSAYKPLVHHFLESIELRGLRRVVVRYPVHPTAPARRFALEAYPLADMLAGIDLELTPMPPAEAQPHYEVDLEWEDGRRRQDVVFAPNRVHVDALGETLLSPTAWLRVRQGAIIESDGPHESEHEALFRLAIDAVMAQDWPASEPYFERLDLRIDVPGIAFAPPEEASWINSHEALHEDLYFTLMELFQRRSGRAAGDRRLQPGQIVPDVRPSDGAARLRIATRPYPAADAQVPMSAGLGRHMALAETTGPLAPAQVAEAFDRIADRQGRPGHRFAAMSRQGRTVSAVYHRGSGPAVLISGGQHANETSGVVGALRAAQALAERPDAHFVVMPLENPDGYALHRELCVPAPRHMHHAARYTALGDDVEFRDAPPLLEREARQEALRLSGADLHVNMHGYPAHEWTRPMSGYIPRGFAFWTVPKGFFLIVRHHAGWGERARRLTEHVCLELASSQALMEFNRKQLASYNVHAGDLPFEVIHGTACMISEVDRQDTAALTLITEFPDETIYGAPFVFAHDAQAAAALAAVDGMRHLSPNP